MTKPPKTPKLAAPIEGTEPCSPLFLIAVGGLQAAFQRELQSLVEVGLADGKYPKGTRYDPSRGVWVLPPIAP